MLHTRKLLVKPLIKIYMYPFAKVFGMKIERRSFDLKPWHRFWRHHRRVYIKYYLRSFLSSYLFIWKQLRDRQHQRLLLLTQPRRQRFFTFYDFFQSFHFSYSTGSLLNFDIKRPKFFKRHIRNLRPLCLLLSIFFKQFFTAPFCIFIKNYNYHNYLFWTQLKTLIKMPINLAILRQGYVCQSGYARRIKRSIWQKLK